MTDAVVTRGSLIAPEGDTKWYEGAGILESVMGMSDALGEADYWGFGGNLVATGLGAIGAIMDPFQAIFAAGVSWLMEHVSFLREPLDALCGDPKEIEGHAQTWRNIQGRIFESVTFFADEVNRGTAEWTAKAADAYKHRAGQHAEAVQALGASCEFMAKCTLIAGAVIGVVRNTIRDLIAEVVGAAVSKAVQALLVVTIPKIVAEVAVLVAECTSKIVNMLQKLTKAISKLTSQLGKLGNMVDNIATSLREASHGATILGAYRAEAAGARLAAPGTGLKNYAGAYRDAFKTVSAGHTAAHGTLPTVLKETAINSARSNTSQNAGSTADKADGEGPPPIELPL
ncbi:hypothetical protein EV385_0197 [Krasilnikovia cinnamomea]|uniref:PPE family protein n=1 Tax=Krasilnikovia cinnamomea TaxID=349313 RepID=A0A4Q7ZE28_9ACTN|nr:hypothetical protein [Krasilnikovia cinnamomea]RZU48481.1 hypothetical protein EV385_0197 [Krasilnikovia cinnamomea]